jgi:hypothetical protein
MLVVGMLEMSRGTMVKVTLCNAARKGCQTGIMQAKGNTDITNDVTNIMRDASYDSTKFNPPSIGSITITVTDPTGKSVPDALAAPAGSTVSVQVSIPVTSTMWITSYFVDLSASQTETAIMQKQ